MFCKFVPLEGVAEAVAGGGGVKMTVCSSGGGGDANGGTGDCKAGGGGLAYIKADGTCITQYQRPSESNPFPLSGQGRTKGDF